MFLFVEYIIDEEECDKRLRLNNLPCKQPTRREDCPY